MYTVKTPLVSRGNLKNCEGIVSKFPDQRKLAAILAADVVGYSRLMALDELGTHSRLKSVLRKLFKPTVNRHGGRIFKMMGDGALVEFASVNQAVDCAVELQTLLQLEEQQDHEDATIKMRIGISLGDVIVAGNDLFGNGVNVAARMESLAEPGSICISGNVREHLNNSDTFELSRKRKELQPCGLCHSNFLVLLRNTEFSHARTEQSIFYKISKGRVLKISHDSERSIGDISETEGDADLRLAQF